MTQSRNWCFTLFAYTLPLFDSLPEWANYIVFQEEECPTTKKRHLQGFVTLKKSQRLSFLKGRLGNGVHLEISRGSSSSNRDYCRKDDSRVAGPWEFGVLAEQGSNKRKTMERFQEDPEEVRLADPKLYRRCLATKINKEFRGLVLPAFDRPWQLLVEKILDKGPDDRTILWVYGSQGNEGKTTWAKSKIQAGWFYSRGGKGENIKYSYAEHLGHVIFDLPRQVEDVLQYSVLEEIKDRLIRSGKYEPIDFNCSDKVHIVVLANFLPSLDVEHDNKGNVIKRQLLSRDRVCIVNIDESVVVREEETVTFARYFE
uniref:AlphaRep protein n=1 Tax=Alphasatellitidae sp. TaxID=2723993 RepID=A0A7G5F334_9VIRU|nr:alphaRep protein [Alphasatellitidae sp.]